MLPPQSWYSSGFCCTARQCSCGMVWACATECLASAGKHASDLAAADARRSSERTQHAQQAEQQAARHASQVQELQRRLEEAVRYLPLTTKLCTCLRARQMTTGSHWEKRAAVGRSNDFTMQCVYTGEGCGALPQCCYGLGATRSIMTSRKVYMRAGPGRLKQRPGRQPPTSQRSVPQTWLPSWTAPSMQLLTKAASSRSCRWAFPIPSTPLTSEACMQRSCTVAASSRWGRSIHHIASSTFAGAEWQAVGPEDGGGRADARQGSGHSTVAA